MNRFNYAPSRFAGSAAFRAALARPAARGPVMAIVAAAALFASTWTVQALRLRALDDEAAALAGRSAALQPALLRMRAAQREVARLESRAATRAAVRATGSREANAIADLGNALPGGAWITSLRFTERAVAVEGRTSRVTAVADALAALGRIPGIARARLLSVHSDPARPIVTYAIALDRVP